MRGSILNQILPPHHVLEAYARHDHVPSAPAPYQAYGRIPDSRGPYVAGWSASSAPAALTAAMQGSARGSKGALPAKLDDGERLLKVSDSSPLQKVAGSIAHTCRNDAQSTMRLLVVTNPSGSEADVQMLRERGMNNAVKALAKARKNLAERKDNIDLIAYPEFAEKGENGTVCFIVTKVRPFTYKGTGTGPGGEKTPNHVEPERSSKSRLRQKQAAAKAAKMVDDDKIKEDVEEEDAEEDTRVGDEVVLGERMGAAQEDEGGSAGERGSSTDNGELHVAAKSNVASVAGAIANKVRKGFKVSLFAIGAGSLGNAIKVRFAHLICLCG